MYSASKRLFSQFTFTGYTIITWLVHGAYVPASLAKRGSLNFGLKMTWRQVPQSVERGSFKCDLLLLNFLRNREFFPFYFFLPLSLLFVSPFFVMPYLLCIQFFFSHSAETSVCRYVIRIDFFCNTFCSVLLRRVSFCLCKDITVKYVMRFSVGRFRSFTEEERG